MHAKCAQWTLLTVSSLPHSSATVAMVVLVPEAMMAEGRTDFLASGPAATTKEGSAAGRWSSYFGDTTTHPVSYTHLTLPTSLRV